MRVIVVGAGVVGFNAALMLSQEKHDVVVVEQSPERLDQVRRKLDVMTVFGSGAHPDGAGGSRCQAGRPCGCRDGYR